MALDTDLLGQLSQISLPSLSTDGRFVLLDRLDSYYGGTQYRGLRYDWDGRYNGYGEQADIAPGWYVPLKQRRPALHYRVAKLITSRFTAMAMGQDRFPVFNVPGDPDAEDYVRALIEESQFEAKLMEARDKGGACGSVAMSFAFIEGLPRVEVHRAKHIKVLKWSDRYDLRPAVALKFYCYERSVLVDGRPKSKKFYYARLWTKTTETIWNPIPEEIAKGTDWATRIESVTVTHNYEDCPLYMAQNLPDSDQEDGLSDYDGLTDDMDELNRLISATSKGTVANVDPTLVVKEDPALNQGSIKKGSDNAIWSKGGAEYLELSGTSIEIAMKLALSIRQMMLDVSGVVLGDPTELSGAARSAAALRLLYQPMLNQCDKLRTQYGQRLAVPLLRGMLRAARKLTGTPGEIYTTADGATVQENPVVLLPPKVTEADGEVTLTPRRPGSSDFISLQWPQYFQPTAQDVSAQVDAASKARGVLISDTTATRYVATFFGVTDVETEVEKIAAERQERMEEFPGPDLEGGGLKKPPVNGEEGESESSKNEGEEE